MSEPIRVLHVLGGLSLGGAESRIMDLYRQLDRENIQFDFLVHAAAEQHFDKEIGELGGKVYRVPRFKVYNWFSYRKALKQFFAEHKEFRAVHGHMTSTASIYLPIAKKAGIPITLAHSRSAGVDSGIKGILTRILRYPLKYRADRCLACSAEAGEAAYGKRFMKKGKVEIIPNAILAQKYHYDESVRNEMRNRLGLADRFVVGHVGSFREAKNHVFLLKIFEEIYKKRQDAVLLLLGDGELRPQIEEQAKQAGLSHVIHFLGNQDDVASYYQAFDYLLFPSLYEGLPGTVVEAQTSGLRCLISDSITKEVMITELVNALSLRKTAKEWAEAVLSQAEYQREDHFKQVAAAGFDIQSQLKRYEKLYQKNVLLLVPLLHQGGFERICAMTARLLEDRYNVTVGIFSSQDMFYEIGNARLKDFDLGSRPGYVGKVMNVLRRVHAVKCFKKDEHIHITYSFGPTANLVNALSNRYGKTWIGIRGYGALEDKQGMRLTCRRADRVICCAKEMADDVSRLFAPGKVECLYNPCDVEKLRRFTEEPVEEVHQSFFTAHGNIIASMSREDDVKGFWHLIKAFTLIRKEIPDAGLMIVGEGEFTEYKKLAADLGIGDSVLFTGVQKNPFSYLKRASIYIMTSLSEGFPNALVEAMAVGVPVMSVNCKTGPAEILTEDYTEVSDPHRVYHEKYGILLPVVGPEKNLDPAIIEEEEQVMAVEAVKLFMDKEMLSRMGKAAAARSESFSVKEYTELLEGWAENQA